MEFFHSFFLSFFFLGPHLPAHFRFWVIIAPDHIHWVVLHLITLPDTHETHKLSLSLSLSHTHTHKHRHMLGNLWTRDRPLATHNIHKRNIHTTGRIRTRISRNQAAADLRLRPRGLWNWRLWSYKFESDSLGGEVPLWNEYCYWIDEGYVCAHYWSAGTVLCFVIRMCSESSFNSAGLNFPDWDSGTCKFTLVSPFVPGSIPGTGCFEL
jgi:hypothetical protein